MKTETNEQTEQKRNGQTTSKQTKANKPKKVETIR